MSRSSPNIPTRIAFPRLAASAIYCVILSVTFLPAGQVVPETRAEGLGQSSAGQEVVTLELGKAIERELSGGQEHNYQIALTEGQ